MNVKKHITAVLAVLLSIGAFAYPAIENEEQSAQFLQQYQQQMQELQTQLEQKLLSPCKAAASFLLTNVQAKIESLSEEQIEALIKKKLEGLTPEERAVFTDENLTQEQSDELLESLVLAILIEQEKQTPFIQEKLAEIENQLAELAAHALQNLDLAQFNKQYNETLKQYGLPEHQFTLPEAKEIIKASYLSAALISFTQEKKLTGEESALLTILLFTQKAAAK